MKVYISVDIEGVAGITHWDEAEKTHRDYPEFREQMTREAIAAIDIDTDIDFHVMPLAELSTGTDT